jgi:hypothetical protein
MCSRAADRARIACFYAEPRCVDVLSLSAPVLLYKNTGGLSGGGDCLLVPACLCQHGMRSVPQC